jgi:hypothetical protein
MKLMKFALATATACLFTAAVATACPGHEKASNTATNASAGSQEGVVLTGSGSGCTKGANASATGCAKGAKMAKGGKACCASKATNTTATISTTSDYTTCAFKPGAVSFKGTVLCNHCDLKKTETCQTMFRTENGCVFTLAGDKAGDLRKDAVGGTKLVRVKGNVAENGELTVSTYRVVKTMASTSAM